MPAKSVEGGDRSIATNDDDEFDYFGGDIDEGSRVASETAASTRPKGAMFPHLAGHAGSVHSFDGDVSDVEEIA